MDNLSKRDLAALAVGAVVIVVLSIWATITVIDKYVLVRDPSDPLVKAGGLNAQQQTK
jgi:hypothetical protein